jgi:hypothetical protein
VSAKGRPGAKRPAAYGGAIDHCDAYSIRVIFPYRMVDGVLVIDAVCN